MLGTKMPTCSPVVNIGTAKNPMNVHSAPWFNRAYEYETKKRWSEDGYDAMVNFIRKFDAEYNKSGNVALAIKKVLE